MRTDTKFWALILAGVCLWGAPHAVAGTSQIEVRWNGLSPIILSHRVSLVLPTGTAISGDVVAVGDDSLTMDVHKTSDRKQPKGKMSIPRASVKTLQMMDTNGTGGRILGVVVGVVGGLVAGGEIAAHGWNTEAGAVTLVMVGAAAGSTGGYFVGKGVDRHTTIIRIVE